MADAGTTILLGLLIALLILIGICLIIVWFHYKKKQRRAAKQANEGSSLLPDKEDLESIKDDLSAKGKENMEKMRQQKEELRKKVADGIESAKEAGQDTKEKFHLNKEEPIKKTG